jgi:hypothetical protein
MSITSPSDNRYRDSVNSPSRVVEQGSPRFRLQTNIEIFQYSQRAEDLIEVIFVRLVGVPGESMEVGMEHQVEGGVDIKVVFEVIL